MRALSGVSGPSLILRVGLGLVGSVMGTFVDVWAFGCEELWSTMMLGTPRSSP